MVSKAHWSENLDWGIAIVLLIGSLAFPLAIFIALPMMMALAETYWIANKVSCFARLPDAFVNSECEEGFLRHRRRLKFVAFGANALLITLFLSSLAWTHQGVEGLNPPLFALATGSAFLLSVPIKLLSYRLVVMSAEVPKREQLSAIVESMAISFGIPVVFLAYIYNLLPFN